MRRGILETIAIRALPEQIFARLFGIGDMMQHHRQPRPFTGVGQQNRVILVIFDMQNDQRFCILSRHNFNAAITSIAAS
jgi:hypothetical protein